MTPLSHDFEGLPFREVEINCDGGSGMTAAVYVMAAAQVTDELLAELLDFARLGFSERLEQGHGSVRLLEGSCLSQGRRVQDDDLPPPTQYPKL